jgi:hypothetical protein
MSKILKRPMFRIGGSANDGIMSMAAPRKNYQEGSEYIKKRDELLPLYQEAMGTGRSERNRLMDLLLEGSLALGAGAGAGKKLPQALALSFKEPAQRYIKSAQEEEAAQRQLKLAATTGAISTVDARRLAQAKEEAAFRLASLKSGTSMPDKIEALTVKYLPDYQNDLNKAKNKATFDLVIRDQIANKFGQTQIGGFIDFDPTNTEQKRNWERSNKNKIGKIFYDLNTGEAKQLLQDANGQLGTKVVDLTSRVVETPTAPIVTDSKTDKKVEDKKIVSPLPKLPPGSKEAFQQAEEERQRRIESLRSQGSKGDKRKELEAFDARIREINRERFGN